MTDAKAPELCVTSLASPVNLVDRRELVGLDSSSGFGNCISPLNSRPISIDSSDSSPPSGGSNSLWMQPLMPSDGELCSSRSSVGDAEKIPDEDWVAIARDDEIVGRHQNVVAVEPTAEPREDEARVNRKVNVFFCLIFISWCLSLSVMDQSRIMALEEINTTCN